MPADNIKIKGLKDFRKELKRLGETGLLGELKDANFEVAELVVRVARANAAGQGPMPQRAAMSMKAGKQAAKAVVSGGGAATPFFAGAEFGSDRFHQFKPWRGAGEGAGYFLYPAIREKTAEIVEKYGDAIEKISRRAFPD